MPDEAVQAEPAAPRPRFGRSDLIGLAMSVVAVVAVVWWAQGQERPRFPTAAADFALLLAGIGVYAVVTLVRGWRWHRILWLANIEHRRLDAFALTVVGYMGNTVLPARGGELLRILLLGERTTARRREILGSIVAERLLDVLSLVALFAALTWSGTGDIEAASELAALSVAAAAALAVALAVYVSLRRRGRFERLAALIRPFVRASRLLFGRVGLLLAATSLGIWFLEATVFWLVARSANVDVTFLQGAFLVVLVSFAASIPAAPGYIGTLDSALVFGLAAFGVEGGQVIAFAVLWRFVVFVPITLAGLGFLFARYGGLPRLRGAGRGA